MKHKIFLIALLFIAISFSKLHSESDTLWTTQIGSTVRTVKFSPDGQYVYAAAEGRGPLKLDAKTGDIVRGFLGFTYGNKYEYNLALDISPDGKTVVGGDFHKLYLYDTETGDLKDSLESSSMNYSINKFNDVYFTKDNKYVIGCIEFGNSSTNTSSNLLIWDLSTKKIINSINGSKIVKLAKDQQNKTLAYIGKQANSENYDIALLEIGTWKNIGVLKGHTSRITDLSFSPDGSLLASCDFNYKMKIWDIEKKEIVFNNENPTEILMCLELISNNLIALSSGQWEQIKIKTFNFREKNEIYSFNFHANDMKFYKNEKVILAIGNKIALAKADRLTSVSSDFTKGIIYPNPATNLLTIPKTFFENNFISLNISDITGNIIYSNDNNQNEDLIIDVSNYPKGTYYINYNYKSGSQSTRFMKE